MLRCILSESDQTFSRPVDKVDVRCPALYREAPAHPCQSVARPEPAQAIALWGKAGGAVGPGESLRLSRERGERAAIPGFGLCSKTALGSESTVSQQSTVNSQQSTVNSQQASDSTPQASDSAP